MQNTQEEMLRHLDSLRSKRERARRNLDKWKATLAGIEEKFQAFEVVLQELGLGQQPTESPEQTSAPGAAQIEAAVLSMREEEITPNSVRRFMQDSAIETNKISTILIRMQKEGILEMLERGRGRRQSRYRLRRSSNSNDGEKTVTESRKARATA